jgi:polyketide cyclase/dehydrase/lipid transport protein
MTELRIWTTRHTIRVPAPPKRVFQLLAHIEGWPELFESLAAVERLGFEGTGERVRFWQNVDGQLRSWTSVRELNPRRMQVRFRQLELPAPLASMGEQWVVTPKGAGSVVVLDHYYRVVGDQADALYVERDLDATSTAMLAGLRHHAEFDGGVANLIESYSDSVTPEGKSTP